MPGENKHHLSKTTTSLCAFVCVCVFVTFTYLMSAVHRSAGLEHIPPAKGVCDANINLFSNLVTPPFYKELATI